MASAVAEASERGSSRGALPTQEDCRAARERLREHVVRTPVRPLPWLSRIAGREVYAKLENQQISGSFKFRGALNFLLHTPLDCEVVTASAGNHALGLVAAARVTGHTVSVCIPHTAAQCKRERLLEERVAVIEHGETLEDAERYAGALAAERGVFVSPYDDRWVIAGQAGVAWEFLEQVPELDALLVPVGGGGLLAGAVLAVRGRRAATRVVGCQAAVFPVFHDAHRSGVTRRAVFRPSLADGLMVNLGPRPAGLELCRTAVEQVLLLDEEAIAAAIHALLEQESLLVEGAGAVGVAAALVGRVASVPGRGPVGIVISGGNATSSAVLRSMTWPLRDPTLCRHLGLLGRTPENELPRRGPAPVSREPDPAHERAASCFDRLTALQQACDAATQSVERLREYCAESALPLGDDEQRVYASLAAMVVELLESCAAQVERCDASGAAPRQTFERHERLLYRLTAFLRCAPTWQSPSYLQAGTVPFARLATQRSSKVNYSRYQTGITSECEERLTEVLGLDASRTGLLLTSSGMAAYQIVEAFLLREVLEPGDTILLPPYLYFETEEQISSLRGIRVERLASSEPAAFAEAVRRLRPRLVFVDALTNTADLRLADLASVLRAIESAAGEPLHVVIDGTMLSGAQNPFALVKPGGLLRVLYYESASKYLQMGLDLTLAGIVCADLELRPKLERLRRNTGTILYEQAATQLPPVDRRAFLARMRVLTRNAQIVASALERKVDPELLRPVFPGLPSHPDHAITARLAHLGGVMTLQFSDPGLNRRDALQSLIERLVLVASERGVVLTSGVSFGFSAPRISAAAAMAESLPPFLRLSVGDQSARETRALAALLASEIPKHAEALGRAGSRPRTGSPPVSPRA